MPEVHGTTAWTVMKGFVEEWWVVILVLVFPLAGFIVNGLWGRRLPRPIVSIVACGSIAGAFLASLYLLA